MGLKIRAGESDVGVVVGELEKLNRKWGEGVASLAGDEIAALEALAARRTQVEARVEQLQEQQAEASVVDDLVAEVADLER
jgi:cell division protein FtsB